MVPRITLVALWSLPLCLALLAMGDPSLKLFVWLTNGGIVLLALVDAIFGYRVALRLTSSAPDVLSLGRKNRVELLLTSNADRVLDVKIRGDLFGHANAGELPLSVRLSSGERRQVNYNVVPNRRGAYTLGTHHARVRSPLGLWDRQLTFDGGQRVRVYPDLKSVRMFQLLARQDREHGFLRSTRRKGGESEFARLREYTRDDEYRAIDWKATARRQKLTAREYQLESNQNLMFMLDTGRLMTAQQGTTTYFDQALNASLLLGQVAARNGDRVGLMGFDDRVRAFTAPEGGPAAPRRLIQTSYNLHPSMVEPDYDHAFGVLSTRVRKRCLVVVFAQVLDEAVAQVLVRRTRALSPRHLPLLVIFRDTDVDAMLQAPASDAVGLYTHAAAAELLQWRRSLINELTSSGVLVLDVTPAELTTQLINRYLEIKARQLL